MRPRNQRPQRDWKPRERFSAGAFVVTSQGKAQPAATPRTRELAEAEWDRIMARVNETIFAHRGTAIGKGR